MSPSRVSFAASGSFLHGQLVVHGWQGYQQKSRSFKLRVGGGPSDVMTTVSANEQGVLASENLSQYVQDQPQKEVGLVQS